MNTEEPRTIITILGYGVSVDVIAAFVLGLIPFILGRIVNRKRYPSRLFKTQFDPNMHYEKEDFSKPLILSFRESGTIYGFHFFVESKKQVDDIQRIGIRPQVKISWLKSLFTDYNSKTNAIDLYERDNPPIRIVDARDKTNPTQITQRVVDDGACGKWLYYAPTTKMKPNSKMIFWVEIQVNKPWKGYIDFRLDTSDGRRVAHHPCELKRR